LLALVAGTRVALPGKLSRDDNFLERAMETGFLVVCSTIRVAGDVCGGIDDK
jgi:hypothetical protein